MASALCLKVSRCCPAPLRARDHQAHGGCVWQKSIQADVRTNWAATSSVNRPHVQCRRSGIQCRAVSLEVLSAEVLGWMVIAGSWLRSVPQILRIAKTKSVEGISVTATVVETLCYTVIIGYNINNYYAISTYGDVFACWIQNLGICGLLAWYRRPTKLQMTVGMILFIAFNWWTICGYCGMRVLTLMQVFVGVAMSLGARVPQIVLNMQRGNTGELAMTTFALSTLGNLVRCYTTIILTSDLLLLATTAAQALLNGIITWQCYRSDRAESKGVSASAAS